MLQRWRSRSESSERARQASRSAGRVGITRARVSSCAWPLNNRFQVNTGGGNRRREGQQTLGLQDQVDRVSVSTHTSPSTNSLHCQKKQPPSEQVGKVSARIRDSVRLFRPLVVVSHLWCSLRRGELDLVKERNGW